jgi:hypothetical protein
MGRHNHENSVAISGYDDLVVLSGDDTFTSGPLTDPTVVPPTNPPTQLVPSQSELFSYIAPDADSVLDDEGDLLAFVSDNAAVDDYYDFTPSTTLSVSGHFITVPRNIATGLNPDGSEMTSVDVPAAQGGPFPPPPTDGSWQRDLRVRAGRGHRVRQTAGDGERRVHRRFRPRNGGGLAGGPVDQRPSVEDGARSG